MRALYAALALATTEVAPDHRLELIELKPETRSDRAIPQDEYRATFRLTSS